MIKRLKNILLVAVLFSACTVPQKYQKNKPFVFKNTIELNGGKFSKDERSSLKQKMYTLLNDSAKAVLKDYVFIYHTLESPAVYDSSYAAISAKNMKNTLLHLGYYQAKSNFTADTQNKQAFVVRKWLPRVEKQQRVFVKYTLNAGNPTLIDTFSYKLKVPELQELAIKTRKESLIEEDKPVTKANVLGEISRLVELYRNNGYYKFTSDELRMRGDTTIAALTNVSDDPFETIRLLEEANSKRDSPTVKLALVVNPESDSSKLMKYYIDNIYIYPDYTGDINTANNKYIQDTLRNASIVRYHNKIVKNKFLLSNLFLKRRPISTGRLQPDTQQFFQDRCMAKCECANGGTQRQYRQTRYDCTTGTRKKIWL
ncbi:MAG: hypothetical protein IPP72_19990 [Chitinophagaceae bacterium]|nr:hypothetical protein [Chitinophagaceae bacterium]